MRASPTRAARRLAGRRYFFDVRRNVVSFRLGAEDVSAIRFGVSPGHELCLAVVALQTPASQPLHWGWLRAVAGRAPAGAWGVFTDLIAPNGYFPDFLSLTPAPDMTPDEQLDLLRAVPAERIRADLAKVVRRATGARREGMFFGINGFVIRFAFTLQGLTAGFILATSGYVTSSGAELYPEQPALAILGIRFLTAGMPLLASLVVLACLARYPLHGPRLARLRQERQALAPAGPVPGP